ncbi:MAG TPA: D-alanyl-D-alanine carboxypeptidase, partial [Ilumatobacteraceae bacterium]
MPPRRERLSPIIVVVVLALIPVGGFAYLAHWATGREIKPVAVQLPVTPVSTPQLATPVLSVRRAPQTLAAITNQAGLVNQLNQVAAFIGPASCLVAELDGRTIVNAGGDIPVIPASNEKLITAAVALDVLGPDYTYSTKLLGTVANGAVSGNLYFVGGGDPLLATADYPASVHAPDYPETNTTSLETLVANLQAAGVTQVGNVVADDSRYDTERFVPTWDPSIPNVDAGPLGALMVNDATKKLGTKTRYADPALGAATDLIAAMKKAGIKVTGKASLGAAPVATPQLAAVQSAPMSTIVSEMLTTSDDNTAELVFKELGYHFNQQGTRASAQQVVQGTLTSWGIDTSKINVVDGSGLDSSDTVTCAILLQVLLHKPLTDPLGQGLAVAGQTGTLADQFL